MDRNSVIGLLLIGAIFIGFSIYNKPSEEEIKAFEKKKREAAIADSLASIESETRIDTATFQKQRKIEDDGQPTEVTNTSNNDSLKNLENKLLFGRFAKAADGKKEYITLENEHIRASISTKGGALAKVELKNYKTWDSLPLYLFDEDSSQFALSFNESTSYRVRDEIFTSDLFFEPQSNSITVSDKNIGSVSMRLYGENKSQYIEYIYSLKGDDYMLDYKVNFVGMDDLLRENYNDIRINWKINAIAQERNIDNEKAVTTVFYKYKDDDDVDYLSERGDDLENLERTIHWVSFKDQYFSSVIICDDGFEKDEAVVAVTDLNSKKYTKTLETNLMLPMGQGVASSKNIRFYFGPNHYQILSSYNIELEEMINLGWPVIRQVSQWIIIPLFNWLDGFNISYGIIILILTLVIKLILFPITYKNYKSSAKMKVLKPEIEALNKKHEKDDPMKKQQAVMALYRKAGVNPMAGCLPMLLQMPILYAMFRFFPASIELRQESFLWADDLSSYDSIYDFPNGFSIPFYGDHISLFTILMAISMYFYTKTNSSMSSMGNSGPQAAQMKIMTNLMPIMMLVFFNNYSSGLSYYYFLANCITIFQQFAIKKWFIDEAAIHAQIQANKLKPQKKSNFQKRLEEMAKQKGYKPPKK